MPKYEITYVQNSEQKIIEADAVVRVGGESNSIMGGSSGPEFYHFVRREGTYTSHLLLAVRTYDVSSIERLPDATEEKIQS